MIEIKIEIKTKSLEKPIFSPLLSFPQHQTSPKYTQKKKTSTYLILLTLQNPPPTMNMTKNPPHLPTILWSKNPHRHPQQNHILPPIITIQHNRPRHGSFSLPSHSTILFGSDFVPFRAGSGLRDEMGVEGVGLRGDGGWVEFEVEGRGGEGEVGLEGHYFFLFSFLFFLGFFSFVLFFGGKCWGVWIDRVVYLYCMDENGDYGSVVVVVVGNRCPRISG